MLKRLSRYLLIKCHKLIEMTVKQKEILEYMFQTNQSNKGRVVNLSQHVRQLILEN